MRAAGHARLTAELHLRAGVRQPYLDDLMRFSRATAPSLAIMLHEPGGPDAMVQLARGYDLGLSGEEPTVLNRRLCLANKIFTYLAAGVPVILSATPAQARLGQRSRSRRDRLRARRRRRAGRTAVAVSRAIRTCACRRGTPRGRPPSAAGTGSIRKTVVRLSKRVRSRCCSRPS